MIKIQWDTFKKLIASLVIFSMLYPDAVRCMQDNETDEFTITHSVQKKESPSLDPLEKKNKSTTGNSPENSDSFDDSLSPRKIEVTEVKTGNNSSGNSPTKELDKTSSEEKTEKSDSGGVSPQKTEQIPNEETIKIVPLNQEITSLSLENKKGEQTQNPIIIVIGGDESQKFNAKIGGNEGKGSPHLMDIQKGVQENQSHIISSHSKKNFSGITFKDDTYYLDEESLPNVPSSPQTHTKLQKSEEGEDWNEKEEKEIDFSSSQPNNDTSNVQQNLGDKLKKEKTISFEKKKGGLNCFEDIFLEGDSSQSFVCKEPKKIVQFLKESFLKQLKPKEKLEEQFVSSQSSINFDSSEIKLTEKDPLIKKDVSMKKEEAIEDELPQNMKDLQERFSNLLTQDEEKTAAAFEEWLKNAEKKLLLEELKNFFKDLPFLQDILFQAAKEMIEKTPSLKKLTVQDWLIHMGLKEGNKIEILSSEVLNFYDLFNKALAFHVASTLSLNQDPSEEDIKAFRGFLLHVKDFTIDGKLTWKQIAGAIGGAIVGGLATYALYDILMYSLLGVFYYYNVDLQGSGPIAKTIAKVLIGFIGSDAVVRNAKLLIEYFSPFTKNFTVPMDSKAAKSLWWKKAGSYGWSLLPALIPMYYYKYNTFYSPWKFWTFGGFLYLNSIWDNSSRLVSNTEKIAQKQSLQKIEENYPIELQEARTSLSNDLEKSKAYLITASQKEINERYEEVYSVLPQINNLTPNNQKLSHVLHLLIFFLELQNLKTSESTLLSSNMSVEMIPHIEKQDIGNVMEEEKEVKLSHVSQNKEEGKPKTLRDKVSTAASYVLPIVGSVALFWGAKYMWGEVISCPPPYVGNCWNKTGIEVVSSVLGFLTLGTVSIVQHFSIKKNVSDLPKISKTKSQPPLRKTWEIGNYVVASGLTIPDFILWATATFKWNPIAKYAFIACATAPEVISTADSFNGSTSDFITGVNRVLSRFVYAPEGFRRQKLIEINNELNQFIQTFKPEVLKIVWKVLPSLRSAWREGTEVKQKDLEKLFDPSVLKAFTQFNSSVKEKRKQRTESDLEDFTLIDEKEENK